MRMMPFAFSLKSETGSLLVTDEEAAHQRIKSSGADTLFDVFMFSTAWKGKMNW